jgi:hypothetical protein
MEETLRVERDSPAGPQPLLGLLAHGDVGQDADATWLAGDDDDLHGEQPMEQPPRLGADRECDIADRLARPDSRSIIARSSTSA